MKNRTKAVSIVLFLSVFTMLVSTVYSQGFKIIQGFSLSNYSVEPDEYMDVFFPPIDGDFETNFVSGLLIGGGIEFNISKNITIEIDALYFQKGSIISVVDDTFQIFKWKFDLNTLSFPMLIKIKLRPGPSAYFLGGGELSFILSHEVNGTKSTLTEETKAFDYGFVTGGGVEIRLKKSLVFLEGRYNFSIRNITRANWPLESIKPNAIVILLGIKI